MAQEEVRAEIRAGTKKLKSDLNKAQGQFRSFGSQITKIAGTIGVAYGTTAIIKWGKATLDAYNIQAQAEQQLLVALKGRQSAQEELIDQAKELQKTTLFGDEETIRAQALIAAFVKEKDQIKTIIPLVQDLAAAKGMDLAVAADLVSKTLGSSTNALSRYGIQVEGAVGSTARLKSLVDGLTNAFGGQAEAAAKVGTGPLQQLKNQYGDIREEIGGVIVNSHLFKAALQEVGSNLQTLSNLVLIIQALNIKIEQAKEKTTLWAQSLEALMKANPIYWLIQYNKLIVRGIDKAAEWAKGVKNSNEAVKSYTNTVQKQLPLAKTAIENQTKAVKEYNNTVQQTSIEERNQNRAIADNAAVRAEAQAAMEQEMLRRIELVDQWQKAREQAFQSEIMGYASAMAAGETYADGIKNVLKDVIWALISKGIAELVANALETAASLGPWGYLVAPALGAAAGGIARAAFSGIDRLAEGGMTTQPQLAMIGDNPSGKEAIIPFEKMGQFLQMVGGAQRVHVTGTLVGQGRSLRAVLRETERYENTIY